MNVQWPEELEEVLAGDQVLAMASVTPARGVVVTPMTNFGPHDRSTGTARVNSSASANKKLDRTRRNPNVALAFHTRHFSTASSRQYVLVQGTATIGEPIENYPATLGERWKEKEGPLPNAVWRRWLRIYYTRLSVDIAVRRIIVWPDLRAGGEPTIIGEALSPPPSSQRPPAGGTAARVDCDRVAKAAGKLENLLLGWVGDDGLPVVVPVSVSTSGGDGSAVRLDAAAAILPPGCRRAGLTAHEFSCHPTSEHERLYTGWLEVDDSGCTANYYPHTDFGFYIPPSTLLYRLAMGFFTRRAVRSAPHKINAG
ncbi:pyridoxamine 5'-phosphate oxidase family protein [Mycobacterium asiaticum]|uniref:Uncharacterized protein n=1 Tax=Mycobacterium asiaticum TaxID=1790 RepID=A0A1A3N032_MYCAS|nr:pyridoxamine 5'-phosphate oxidase family protein [Mycobacterium asiaticum]OBK13742.1 hypothetical protein A5636_09130 [Mycobacterium asiaticum]